MPGPGRKKGTPKTGGRAKGTPNKVTADVRQMTLEALRLEGGVDYLRECARDPKTKAAFLTLVGKCMPLKFEGEDLLPLVRMFVAGPKVIDPAAVLKRGEG